MILETTKEAYEMLDNVCFFLQENWKDGLKVTLTKEEVQWICGEAESIVNLCYRMERLAKPEKEAEEK